MKKIIILSLTLLNLFACNDFDDDVKDIKISSGEADFSRYIALGNSLTSGYRDGALYLSGQKESYPAMLAEKMKVAGGGDFKIPFMDDDLGGIPSVGVSNKFILSVVNGSLAPITAPGTGSTTLNNIFSSGPYQNMGVPGAKSFHLIAPGYGNPAGLSTGTANPYFVRFASSPTTSVLADAVAQNPTFFSLWIGNNDVLGYATSGGDGSNPITSTALFQTALTTLVQGLTANGAKGVLANIPYVTTIPFFTTVPSKPFTVGKLSSTQISQLNAAYTAYNNGLLLAKNNGLLTQAEVAKRQIVFSTTEANGAVIIDKELTNLSSLGIPSYRMTTSDDLLLLTASSLLTSGGGTQAPLADKYVLTKAEKETVLSATDVFNNIIKNLTTQYNLAFADMNTLMSTMNSGMVYNGTNYSAIFVTGGAFSLDGVHPNGRGYGFVANEFIRAINTKYHSTLTYVNPNSYTGVLFP